MANDTTLLKYSLKTNTAKSLYFDIISKLSHYYYAFGRTAPWPTVTVVNPTTNVTTVVSDDSNPPSVSDTYSYELDTRRNIQYVKLVNPQDACLLVNRYDWQTGALYDQYDEYTEDNVSATGAASLSSAQFYVLTDEMNVYKCLYNNKNSVSTVKPTGTSPYAFTTSDGYIWKFMYSIPLSLRNRFLLPNYMPISNSMSDQFYSKGAIKNYRIVNKGNGYISNTWRVKTVRVLTGGSGYTTGGTVLEFTAAPNGGTRAIAVVSAVGTEGDIISVNVTTQGAGYRVQPTLTILSAPAGAQGATFLVEYEKTNTSGTTEVVITGDGFNEYNPYSIKTVSFSKIVSSITITNPGTLYSNTSLPSVTFSAPQLPGGVTATGTAVISGGVVSQVNVGNGGTGYTSASITFSAPELPAGVTATGTVTIVGGVVTGIVITNAGSGYTSAPTATLSGDGINATIDSVSISSSSITGITITNPGYGYTSAPTITIAAPANPNGIRATATANMADNRGTFNAIPTGELFAYPAVKVSYGQLPDIDVTFRSKGGGLFEIDTITLNSGGFGYDVPLVFGTAAANANVLSPTLTDNGVILNLNAATQKNHAKAIPIINSVNGQITAIQITEPGIGYTYATVDVVGSMRFFEAGNTVQAMSSDPTNPFYVAGKVVSTVVTKAGSGYTSVPTITFSAPQASDGVRATGTAVMSGAAVTGVTVVNGGSGYILPPTVTFSPPQKAGGTTATATAILTGGEVTGFNITNNGSGYTSAPTVTISGDGVNATATATIGGNTLTGITITERGSGYSSAPTITVSAPESGVTATARANIFTEADITIGFEAGDVDSKQSDVELLAIDGSIEVIEVDEGGLGFSSSSELTVIGDGEGCKCTPVVVNGQLSKVIVTDPGAGYTFASVVVSGGGTGAVIRPILSPKGGHGKDAIEELYASVIMLTSRLVKEKNQSINITNDFRQITIVKDLEKYGDDVYFTSATGSSCAVLKFDKTVSNTTVFGTINQDDILYLASDTNKYVTVLEKVIDPDYYTLLVSLDTNYLPTNGTVMRKVASSTLFYDITINDVVEPTINKYSGQMLYVDNRTPFVATEEQTVAVNTLITL